jgi:chromosome segregation ATPase
VGSEQVLQSQQAPPAPPSDQQLAVLMAERDQLAARAAALTQQLLEAEAALSEVESQRVELTDLRASVLELSGLLDEAKDEHTAAYRQIRNLTRELEATHNTVSWRMTSALRATRRLFRRST